MRRTPITLAALAALTLALALGACADDEVAGDTPLSSTTEHAGHGGDAPAAFRLDVKVPGGDREYAFEPSVTTIEEGPVEVVLENLGAEEHQAMVLRLDDGVDLASFAAQAASDPTGTAALALVEGFGGPNGAGPGKTVSSTQYLVPGNYLLLCFLPGADGAPHASKGMVSPFTVTPKAGGAAADQDDGTGADVTLLDFAFDVPGKLPAGDTLVVTNEGGQAHEVGIARLADGQTADEAIQAFLEPASGATPPELDSGLGLVAPGRTVRMVLPEEPGDYVFFCMVPDTVGDGKPHVMKGMVREVSLS